MKKKENVYLTAIEDVYLLRIQITEESGVKCFFEVTISKEIDSPMLPKHYRRMLL